LSRAIAAACLFLLAVSLAGCEGKEEKDRERAAAEKGKEPAAKVSADGSIQLSAEQVEANGIHTVTPRQEALAPAIAVVGRVQAQPGHESEVFSPFAGRLIAAASSPPGTGTAVKQGQVLAELEQLLTASERTQYATQITQLDAAATQAQQEVDLRRVELDRTKQLYDGGAIPLKQVQTAEFNLQQAESRLQSAKASAADFRALLSAQTAGPRRISIVAPISGVVVTSNLIPGMQVDPAKSLMKIVDLSTVWVDAAVPEAQLGATRQAGRAEVTSPAVPGRVYPAALVTVSPTADLASRTVRVIYSVANGDGMLKVDMTTEVRIPTGPRAQALLVPASAVLYGAGQAQVFVEQSSGLFQRRTIVTGESRGLDVVVSSGLNAGEKVVSAGAEALRSELLRGTIPTEEH
jgi:cobalt-zinc-cadmium efflux system membrane fusion protein